MLTGSWPLVPGPFQGVSLVLSEVLFQVLYEGTPYPGHSWQGVLPLARTGIQPPDQDRGYLSRTDEPVLITTPGGQASYRFPQDFLVVFTWPENFNVHLRDRAV